MLADLPLDSTLTPVLELPVIAHLAMRWDPAWHRAHRLLRALGTGAPVLVVEEAVVLEEVRRERLDIDVVAPGVWRAGPRLPPYLREPERAATAVRALLQAAMRPDGALGTRFTGAVHWFARLDQATAFVDELGEVGVVIDGLSVERLVSAEPDARERTLFERGDLVLATSGNAAFLEARHRNVLRIDDGVDASWCDATDAAVPAALAPLPRPIFGYLGAVDDRVDHALLRALRARAPDGSVVLVGPPGRPPADGAIAPALPPGVHWIGAPVEAALPAFVRAFDVCVFPLVARDDAAPAETPAVLECLVAGRPVVASVRTPLPRALAGSVMVAATPTAFAAAAAAAVGATSEPVAPDGATWEDVALRVRGAIFEAISARITPLGPLTDALVAVRGIPAGPTPDAR